MFRYDTRIYLDGIKKPSSDDCCIDVIVGENPSSVKPKDLDDNSQVKIELDGDKLLPTVRNIIRKVGAPKSKK